METTNYLKTMEYLIGKTVIFQTERKPMRSKTLTPIFPEHTFSATIMQLIGDFVLITDIKLLSVETNNEYGRKFTLLARDKLHSDRPTLMNGDGLIKTSDYNCLIKIANNLYFDVYIYNHNTDLLKSIENHKWFPNLYDVCFYNLSSMEMNFAREFFNAAYERNNCNLN